jgi:hypothetical protein
MPRERRADNNSVPNEYIMQPRLNTFQDKKKKNENISFARLSNSHPSPNSHRGSPLGGPAAAGKSKKGKNFLKKEIKDTRDVYTLGVSSHTNISALVI